MYAYVALYQGDILAVAKTPESALNFALKFWNTSIEEDDEETLTKNDIKISEQFIFD